MSTTDAVRDEISTTISNHPVVLFMKGKRRMPQCGFSAQVVQILDELVPEYATINVLENPEIREGIKDFSNWPTIPQLYVNGQFVGGCDIVVQMYQTGELHQTLGVEVPEVDAPEVTITPSAAEQFLQAINQAGPGHRVRLEVNASFRPGLNVDGPRPGDFELESSGVPVVVDRMSAARADGVTVDFVPGPNGGFKIDNPNEPARVREIEPGAVLEWQKAGVPFEFVDVRTPEERAKAVIPGSELMTLEEEQRLSRLPKDTTIVFTCHHGGRSLQAAQRFLEQGFTRVYNLRGGIDAWALQVDNSIPRY
jgi:monothiol glutaredoxin